MNIEKTSAIEFEQNGITLWACALKCKHLAQITYVARRGESDETGAVQRLLNKSRIKGIKEFVLEGGMFPNSIILNWTSEKTFSFNADRQIEFKLGNKMAQIIDGQHRIEGIKEALKEKPEIGEIAVPIIFMKQLDTPQCAKIFLSINTEQRPVPKSLVYDLYGIAFPHRDYVIERARDIAETLNEYPESPYLGYIKFPKARRMTGGIQLSNVTDNLKKFVKQEGDFEKVNVETLENQAKLLINYFSVFKDVYGQSWNKTHNPFIFAAGFSAALDILSKLLPLCFARRSFSKETFASLLKFDRNNLIYQSAVKGLSGEAAKDKIKEHLNALIDKKQKKNETDFEF